VDESRKELTPEMPEQAAEEVEVHYEAAEEGQDAHRSLLKQLVPGTVVSGKYRIDSILGRGAMGVVVAATHLELREAVALKFLYAKTDSSEDFRSRFRREAQVSAKLRNEHITRVLDIGTWREGAMFMVMEYLAGNDLRKMIRTQGPFSIQAAVEYIVQICEGVAEAHAHGIIHRDLKPSNLLVTTRPDGSDLVKILDFGISKWAAMGEEEGELTQTGVVLGSPKYMSPEQLFGAGSVDSRTDIWSIGAILYELLTGRPPYDQPSLARICADLASNRLPTSIRDHRPDAPVELEAVVFRCLERNIDKRVQDVAELAGDLLGSIGSPYGEQVRARIRSTLDPSGNTTGNSSLRQTRGAAGTYSGLSFTDSSASYPRAAGSHGDAPGGTAGPTIAPEGPQRTRRTGLVVAGVLAVAVAGVVLLATRDSAPPVGATTAIVGTPPPAPSPPVAAVAAPTGTDSITQSASASATAPVAKPVDNAVRHVPQNRPPVRPGSATRTNTPPTTATPEAPPVATPPPATPPATTATTEAPKKKINPLEDRQ
jgi:eukaryotic-like serine/threonine-protein kinase